jgi:hypothetical protein
MERLRDIVRTDIMVPVGINGLAPRKCLLILFKAN